MASNESRELPSKQAVSLALLEEESVYLHLDPRRPGVSVPAWLARQPQLTLQVGLRNMVIPIPDLHVGDDGITCTLSFNRAPFHCTVPWHALFAVVGESGRGMVWPEDVPAEVVAQAQPLPEKKSATPLRAVPPKPSSDAAPAAGKPKAKRPRSPEARARRAEQARMRRQELKQKKLEAQAAAAIAPPQPVAQGAPPMASPRRPRVLPPYLRVVK
jgi:stringent starvation protein B